MSKWLAFIAGAVIGGSVGAIGMALLIAGTWTRRADA